MKIDFAKCEYGQEEKDAVNKVMESSWLASGPETEMFEKEFASYVGVSYAVCVNSGTSANLIALASLNLPNGSKVLTSACGFPATLTPILHLGLEPVLVDYDLSTLNIDVKQVLRAIITSEIKAVIIAHSLGNPVDLAHIRYVCNQMGIAVIEDCCEAVGSKLNGQSVGSKATLATFSFYPAHQITALGGGGMITTNSKELWIKMKSLRDWGKVWDWDDKLGHATTSFNQTEFLDYDKPYYKHYTYQSVGWNMKLPDANSAFGRVQLKKLDRIHEERSAVYNYIKSGIEKLGFGHVEVLPNAQVSWFGFPLVLKRGDRNSFSKFLIENGIGHRPFFAGNITRHKPFGHLKGDFQVADRIMDRVLFFGCWQGMTHEQMDYIIEKVKEWTLINTDYQ
mgnify:CR=1 FL=1